MNFGKTRFKTSVFEKHFISYSCILFIKYYALRSFCIKLLCFSCFSKKLVFPEFRSTEPVSRLIEIAIKSLVWLCVFQSMLNWFWINRRHFRSIKPIFSINQKSYREFLKPLFPHVFFPIQTFFKTRSLSIRSVYGSKKFFCRLPPNFLQGFSPLRSVRPFYPSFCIYFHVSCIKSCILRKILNQWISGISDDSSVFLKIDQWVFVIRCYITVLVGLI